MNHSLKTVVISCVSCLLVALPAVAAQADQASYAGQPTYTSEASYAPAGQAAPTTFKQKDLLSLGLGYEDFDKSLARQQAANFRGEYRWGLSLLPLISESWFRPWDNYVQFHPWAGLETTTLGSLWAGGGWATDFYIGRHGIVTWSEGVGFYEPGDSRSLHGNAEFRSQLEAGWRFTDESRLTLEISHESDAGLTRSNPGEETAGIYYHIPFGTLLGAYPR